MTAQKGPAAGDCEALKCSATNNQSHNLSRFEFQAKLTAYRIAKAALDTHCAIETPEDHEPYETQTDALSDIHAAVIDALLLTPATSLRELMHKLRVMATEDIMQGWHQGPAIMALAACDGDRLLRRCTS